MKKYISVLSLVALCCLLALFLASCGGGGGGSSAFAKPGDGDGGDGDGDGDGGGVEGTLKWSTAINSPTGVGVGSPFTPPFVSSPAIAPDGTAYVGSTDHFLYALKPDGTVKWKFETGGDLSASPAIGSDGTIYIGSADRQFYAINPDGTLKWIFPTKAVFTSSAAIGADGTIYAAGTHKDLTLFVCPTTVGYCSVSKTTSCTSDANCPTGEECILGNVAISQLGSLFAINPDGTEKWEFRVNKSGFSNISGLSGVVHSSPAVASDGTIYIGTEGDVTFDRSDFCDMTSAYPPSNANPNPANGGFYPVNGHLYAINPNGTLKWDFKTLGYVDSSPAIGADGTVYVGSRRSLKFYGKDQATLLDENPSTRGFVYAINPDGTRKWVDDLLGDVDSSPAVGSDGTIYVGADNFHVYALNPANGSIKWVEPTRDMVKSSPAIASDGTIYIGSNDKSIYAFNPDGTEKSRLEAGGSVNSGPSIWSGTIYFTSSDGKLTALSGTRGIGLADSPWPKFRHDLINNGRR